MRSRWLLVLSTGGDFEELAIRGSLPLTCCLPGGVVGLDGLKEEFLLIIFLVVFASRSFGPITTDFHINPTTLRPTTI